MLPVSKLRERFAGKHALITGASVGIGAAMPPGSLTSELA